MNDKLEIVYIDDFMVAINKPHGLLVHRTRLDSKAEEFALQKLRDQLNQHVFPAHRLDRKTGGILLFSLDTDTDKKLQPLFAEQKIEKKYLAIVRGYTDDEGEIDYPLLKENGNIQESFTVYSTLGRAELDVPFGIHTTSRYSFLEVVPKTGRMHQIRRHLAHIHHPIIGDRPHGCNKQNRLFKQKCNLTTMLLHASELNFIHPVTGLNLSIKANPQSEFLRMTSLMGWEDILENETESA
jgi:tRNA pseudouridine65 synthase